MTLKAPCRHTFCRMYGLTTQDEYRAELCIKVLNDAIDAELVDADMLELVYCTEGYLAALEAFADQITKPLLTRLPTTVDIYRNGRQLPERELTAAEKAKRAEWRKVGAIGPTATIGR